MPFFRRKKKDAAQQRDDQPIASDDVSDDIANYYELVQSITGLITKRLEIAGINTDARHVMAYSTLTIYLFRCLGIIPNWHASFLRSVQVVHYSNDLNYTKEEVRKILEYYESKFIEISAAANKKNNMPDLVGCLLVLEGLIYGMDTPIELSQSEISLQIARDTYLEALREFSSSR